MSIKIRTYSELILIPNYKDRFEYLRLDGEVGADTFGYDRYLNQLFYHSDEWKRFRREIILRDSDGYNCLDLAHLEYPINGRVIVHHMNPITIESINDIYKIMNVDQVVCVSHMTHNAIHYGTDSLLQDNLVHVRKPGDTCPWK